MEPILKWAGGKRQLLSSITNIIHPEMLIGHTFYEPFVGGGSVFISYAHSSVVINDYNEDLMNVYKIIKNNPTVLIKKLKEHRDHHSHDYFYEIRSLDRKNNYTDLSEIDKAARLIYLNRTCFNGLYRVNSQGYFNVPIGRYVNPDIVNEEKIIALSNYLNSNNVQMLCGDFEDAVSSAKKGDFVYFDPPYDYEENGFTSYTSGSFTKSDLVRLKLLCDKLIKKGCFVLISNNDTDFVRLTFDDKKYTCETVLAKRMINCNGKKRSEVREVLIYG